MKIRKSMQTMPLTGDQREAVQSVLQSVLEALKDYSDGRFDAGNRVVVNLSHREVTQIRQALKRL